MNKTQLLQGTLDLLILRILELGPNHGWGISSRLQQISKDGLKTSQGSLYPALHRLEMRGEVKSEMTASENNRRARVYTITRAGRKRLNAGDRDLGGVRAVDAARPGGGPMIARSVRLALRGLLRRRRIDAEIRRGAPRPSRTRDRGAPPARCLARRGTTAGPPRSGRADADDRIHPCRPRDLARHVLARPEIRCAAVAALAPLHGHGADRARPRHRLDDGDFLDRVCGAGAAVALCRRRSAWSSWPNSRAPASRGRTSTTGASAPRRSTASRAHWPTR